MSDRRFWTIAFIALTLLFLVLTWALSNFYMERRIEAAGSRLALLGDLRRSALENYFATGEAELRFWSTDPLLVDSQSLLVEALHNKRQEIGDDKISELLQQKYIGENPFPENRSEFTDPGDGTLYTQWHAQFHPMTRLFVEERGYYDFFMISPDGFILYTVEKESDFATNLLTGPWKDTALAHVFRRAMASASAGQSDGDIIVSDIQSYGPSNNEPALFMAHPVIGKDETILGVIAVQLPIEGIKEIMQFTNGMGSTGETYIVGKDLVMRSDSRFSEEPTTLKTVVDTTTVKRALAGESGIDYTLDYRDTQVLSAYSSLDIGGHIWAVMAEKDVAELEEDAAGDRTLLGGLMLFFYGLSLWSLWYIRSGEPGEDQGNQAMDDQMFNTELTDG